MGLFSKLFNRNKDTGNNSSNLSNEEYSTDSNKEKVISFINQYNNLLSQDRFLSRSSFFELKEYFREVFENINVLINTNNLNKYCKDIGLDIEKAYTLSWDDKYAELCNEQNKAIESIVTFDKDMPKVFDEFIYQIKEIFEGRNRKENFR